MSEENKIIITPEGHKLTLTERESAEININLSTETINLLEAIAKKRDLSVISVIKLFIGKGIRDLEPELAEELALKRFKNRKQKTEETEEKEVDLAA